MKIHNKDLNKAYNLVRNGKYPQAIRFLEPKVPLFLEDELFYFLLGKSCFHTGDLGGSEFYFKRSLQVNNGNVDSRLYLAAVQLKKKDQANAARLWLNILDLDSENRLARKGLDRLKRIKDPSELDNFINSAEVNRLVPPMKGMHPVLVRFFLITAALALLTTVAYFVYPMLEPERSDREQIANLSLDNYIGPYVELDGDFIYSLDGDEIRKLFESAVEDFHNYDDNALQMKINKINLSNASNELKSKITILEGLIQQPNFMTLKTRFTYKEIIREPLLYRNCYVLWTGRVTNVSYKDDKITLDFLVGYEDETVLEGIAFVEIPFETSINEAVPMEILGQIRYRDGKIFLTAVSVRSIIN